jgi:hypothetical protein
MFGAAPIRRNGPVGLAENDVLSSPQYDERNATNHTMETTMNSSVNTTVEPTPHQNSVHRSPTKSPGRRDDDGMGTRIATFLDDMLPHQSARSHTAAPVTSTGSHSARGSDATITRGNAMERRQTRSRSPRVGLRSSSVEQQQAHNARTRIAYPGEARAEFAKRISEGAKDKGLHRVVGLHVPVSTGLRVKPVDGGLPQSTLPHRIFFCALLTNLVIVDMFK